MIGHTKSPPRAPVVLRLRTDYVSKREPLDELAGEHHNVSSSMFANHSILNIQILANLRAPSLSEWHSEKAMD